MATDELEAAEQDQSKLRDNLRYLRELKDRYASLKKVIDSLTMEVAEEIQKEGETFIANDGARCRARVIYGERVTVDENKAEEELPQDVYEKVTKRVVDRTRFEKAMLMGYITQDQATRIVRIQQNAPYVRFQSLGTDEDW